ncbi:MAG TPA: TAXI family TRAP transporter solute-binding subunit [Spirochaetota bacterium]|nr:TAXI family TRAP transporter solute-binding subunit [Spirochaetota bacterium]HPI90109.1 TAXI family TRAP transporter solute-binding subunit [Spirochaetota bacterium]HPR49549.1 TAXI family TRAP transporter solute-binding subunit [Spirochaetota bacterium]
MIHRKLFPSFLSVLLLFILSSCDTIFDDSFDVPRFSSGPQYGNYYPYAEGVIDSAEETLGVFMENHATQGSLENARRIINGKSYMGLVQEDIFDYVHQEFYADYGSGNEDLNYLKIAARLRVIMAMYEEDVHLLVNTGSAINDMDDLVGADINVGPVESGTFITAKTILSAHGTTYTEHNDDVKEGIEKVISGEYDAAFFVTASPSQVFLEIASSAPVKLIQVQMPQGNKKYSEKGVIQASEYPFQADEGNIIENITVKTLLVAGDDFLDEQVDKFIENLYLSADEYSVKNSNWKFLNRFDSEDYFIENPQLGNYRAMCHIMGFTGIDETDYYFYAGLPESFEHDTAVELIWLLSHNIDVDLKERYSTGSGENAIRILDGSATMAIVDDDIYYNLASKGSAYESLKAASLKKVMPLHDQYLHLLVNNGSGITGIGDFPGMTINLCEKTSGTFLAAMRVIKSYNYNENDNIVYQFDPPDIAIPKVESGEYDATFVLTGFPYPEFKYVDTADAHLVSIAFNGDTPILYESKTVDYDSRTDYPNIGNLSTLALRAVIVQSPVFHNGNMATFIKSVYRKANYLQEDNDEWSIVTKQEGKDYFARSPFGWSDIAVKYYLSLFD